MLAETLSWWLVLEGIGLIALPITLLLFRTLPGKGIAFAKPLGLLLGGYLFWLALTAHLLPNRPGSIVWVFIAILAVDYLILRVRWREMRALLEERWGLVLAVELVFTLALFTAAHIRSYIPEIAATEKPMDFMFLNTAARSTYYPPEDAWFAGFDVSYYYFGYVITAMVGKLAAVETAVAFNLGLAGTAALAVTAAFGLGYELVSALRRVALRHAIAVGIAAALLVGVVGNLEGVLEFGKANGVLSDGIVEAVDISALEGANESDSCLLPVVCIKYPTEDSSFWWWWRATRLSPDAGSITEFPFFSFILGDLHPHVMAIPYVLTVFALGLSLWRLESALSLDTWRRSPPMLLLSAVLLGGLGFLNTWDLPTFGFLVSVLVVARNLSLASEIRTAVGDALSFLLPLGVLAVMLYSPFYLGFGSQASGLAAVTDGATRPVYAVLFWGPLFAVSLPLPFYLLAKDPAARDRTRLYAVAALPGALLIGWALLVMINEGGGALGDAISARGWNWLTALFFAIPLSACVLSLWRAFEGRDEEDSRLTVPALVAMGTALLLILGAELFFVRDVFNSRLNSVFKLYYQAWLLLGVSGAAGAYLLIDRWRAESETRLRPLRLAWAGVTGLVLAAALLYPLGATRSRTEGMSRPGRTLDGLAGAARAASTREDYLLVNWLLDRADAGERLVEAVGSSYSTAARASAWSGIPTVLGWPGHETQWARDGTELRQRQQDVEAVYQTETLAEALEILRKYGVTYVVVGVVERATYPDANLQKFEEGLQAVYRVGQSAIYRLPPQEPTFRDEVASGP